MIKRIIAVFVSVALLIFLGEWYYAASRFEQVATALLSDMKKVQESGSRGGDKNSYSFGFQDVQIHKYSFKVVFFHPRLNASGPSILKKKWRFDWELVGKASLKYHPLRNITTLQLDGADQGKIQSGEDYKGSWYCPKEEGFNKTLYTFHHGSRFIWPKVQTFSDLWFQKAVVGIESNGRNLKVIEPTSAALLLTADKCSFGIHQEDNAAEDLVIHLKGVDISYHKELGKVFPLLQPLVLSKNNKNNSDFNMRISQKEIAKFIEASKQPPKESPKTGEEILPQFPSFHLEGMNSIKSEIDATTHKVKASYGQKMRKVDFVWGMKGKWSKEFYQNFVNSVAYSAALQEQLQENSEPTTPGTTEAIIKIAKVIIPQLHEVGDFSFDLEVKGDWDKAPRLENLAFAFKSAPYDLSFKGKADPTLGTGTLTLRNMGAYCDDLVGYSQRVLQTVIEAEKTAAALAPFIPTGEVGKKMFSGLLQSFLRSVGTEKESLLTLETVIDFATGATTINGKPWGEVAGQLMAIFQPQVPSQVPSQPPSPSVKNSPRGAEAKSPGEEKSAEESSANKVLENADRL